MHGDTLGTRAAIMATHTAILKLHVVTSTTVVCCCPSPRRDDESHLAEMVEALRNDEYTALILDFPALEHITSDNDRCDLHLVGDTFNTFSLALAFPAAFDDAVIYSFSRNIVRLQVGSATV